MIFERQSRIPTDRPSSSFPVSIQTKTEVTMVARNRHDSVFATVLKCVSINMNFLPAAPRVASACVHARSFYKRDNTKQSLASQWIIANNEARSSRGMRLSADLLSRRSNYLLHEI